MLTKGIKLLQMWSKKDVEVDIITKKVKNIVHIVFEMKKEIEELELRIVQNGENLNGIPKLVQEHPIKLSKCF